MRFCTILFVFHSFFATAQNMDAKDWKVYPGTIKDTVLLGRKALYVSRGVAYLPISNLSDGTIEVDMMPGLPGFTGLAFHINDSLDYEQVYIRYFKSGGPDALQYSPVFKGEFSWQFYPEYQAAINYPANDWIHMRIVSKDYRASVFVVTNDSAALLVDSLRLPDKAGRVGIWTLTGSYFSNFRYKPSVTDGMPAVSTFPAKLTFNPNAIKQWEISEPFEFSGKPLNQFSAVAQKSKWKNVVTEPDGFLNINKYARKKKWGNYRDNSNDAVWLKCEWREQEAGTRAMSFDFSNQCSIFINTTEIFSGNNSLGLKGPLYLGDIDKQLKATTIFLPVKKGKNTLAVAVAGISNGWGFIAQFANSK